MTFLAMKVLHEELALDRVFMRRFQREAQTLSKLQHPNIVRFYGLEQQDRLAFMLLDYIEGETLKHKIFDAAGPMPLDEIRSILRSVCGALQFAHSNGMVHCDIKPGNIMIDQHGKVLVTDFGIARMTDAATATMVGAGTPAYMAPEQARGLDPLPQTDIYALGIILYEMFTGGERPFTGEQSQTTGSTSEKVRWEQIYLKPPSPKRWNPDISDELEAMKMKCLAKNPANRYASPLDLLNALDLALPAAELVEQPQSFEPAVTSLPLDDSHDEPDEPQEPKNVASPFIAEKKPQRRSLVPVLVGIAIVVVGLGASLFVMGGGRTGQAADTPTVTASPLPTETSEDTTTQVPSEIVGDTAKPVLSRTPENTATLVPTKTASITPTPTWTISPTSSKTLSPTSTKILSPTPITVTFSVFTYLRAGPDFTHPSISDGYEKGEFAEIFGRNNDWYLVRTYTGEEGWLYKDWLEINTATSKIPQINQIPTSPAKPTNASPAKQSPSITPVYVPAASQPKAILTRNSLRSTCKWDVQIYLSGFAPNSNITVSSKYTEVECRTGKTISSSWTVVYSKKTDQYGNLTTAYLHQGTGSYRYTFTDVEGNQTVLSFSTEP